MDRESFDIVKNINLDTLKPISLDQFEDGDEELLRAKQNRSRIEYYFTCSPSLPLFILNHFPKVDAITYLDADLYFFDDPRPIFDEIGNNSIAIIEHRFSPHLKAYYASGIYNVGLLYFKRDNNGISCLARWREQCNEWCCDKSEDGKYADQKYLDAWPGLFDNLVVLQHKGANLAPWNIANYDITARNGIVWVDDQPLIFYHFQGIKHIFSKLYDSGLSAYQGRFTRTLLNNVYMPYLYNILSFDKVIKGIKLNKKLKGIREPSATQFNYLRRISPQLLAMFIKFVQVLKTISSGTYIILNSSPSRNRDREIKRT
ncbi:MAG: glycosyl transferase [Syntrophus sp. (in: bacteria)]|nr:glycosyl transferase [Syntrophus sp. (in: bacteria)]